MGTSPNLTLYPRAASVSLARALEFRGFQHALRAAPNGSRVMFEVYPYAALVVLFALDKIVKYKKGTLESKRSGLKSLRALVWQLTEGVPRLLPNEKLKEFLAIDIASISGQRLKNYEDALDALVCAYLAFHWRPWGESRTEAFGDISSGYIVNPTVAVTVPYKK